MPGSNLTRQEALERSELITVGSYSVTLDFSLGDEVFGTDATLVFECTRPGSATFIDFISPRIDAIQLNGENLDPATVFDGTRIQLHNLAANNTLKITGLGTYMNTGEGLHRFVDPADGETYLYTQFEVADSRRVFPVFEQPDLKAHFTFSVIAPSAWTVLSNESVTKVAALANGLSRTTFHETPRISSYITAIIAGPYVRYEDTLVSSDGRVIPLGVFGRASLAQYLDAPSIVETTKAGFAFYEKHFDRAYPFSKYDQIFVPEFNAGAMENAGCVTFTESYVFRSKVPEATVERLAVTVLHELAHMWFGDLVTMSWWDDLWLNESFAEYMSTLACAEATRWTQAWTTFSSLEKSWAYRQDQLPSTHPIVADMRDLEDVEVNFDGITYAKGASVLKQLVAYVGRDAFFAGVQAYFRKHAWTNTTLNDFLHELELTSGRDLRSWSAVWLEKAGVTMLCPEITNDEAGYITSFTITQEVPAEHPVQRPHRIGVGGYTLTGEELTRTWFIETDIDGARTELPELVGKARPPLILVNDEDLAYAKIRLDETSLETAKAHMRGFTDSLARSLIWSAAWDMTRDAEWPAHDYVDLVLANIAAETDSTVTLVLLRQLGTCLDLYVAPERRDQVLEATADRLWELVEAATPGSDSQLQLLKSFALYARSEAQLTVLRELVDKQRVLPGLQIDTDLQWELLRALVAAKLASTDEIDAALAADTTAAGERAAAMARAMSPILPDKRAAWDSLIDSGTLPNAIQTGVIAGFRRAHDLTILEPFVKPYFEMLTKVWDERTNEMAQNLVTGLYPIELTGWADSRIDIVGLTRTWLDEHENAPAGLRRLLVENLAAAQRAETAQARDRY